MIAVIPFWFPSWYSFYPFYPGYDDYYDFGYPAYLYSDSANYVYPRSSYPPLYEVVRPYEAVDGGSSYSVFEPLASDESTVGAPDAAEGPQYHASALGAFQKRDYRNAARLANHAVIELPGDAKVHELFSLSLFAVGEYRGAAIEGHAAAALGPLSDWPGLYVYYNDLPTYTAQLDALRKFLRENPSSLDARFLLAYHDLMMGHVEKAKLLLTEVVAKSPQDKVAAQLLKQAADRLGKPAPAPPPPEPKPSP